MKADTSVQYIQLRRLIDDVDRVATEKGIPAPGEFLAMIMAGQDPRPMDSPLYELVKRIQFREFAGGDAYPTPAEWSDIIDMVLNSDEYRRSRIGIEQSLRASEKLMEYLHAKMKAVEVSGGLDVKLEVTPLTGDELDAFKAKFEDEF